jgi:hypothetical protein
MSNTKCPRCGLVNLSSDEVCERCGVPLDGGDPDARSTGLARPDFPILALGGNVPTGSKTWKLVLVVILAVALCGAAWVLYKRRADARRSSMLEARRNESAQPSLDEVTRETVLSYLAQPSFAGARVSEQLLGPVRLEMLHVPDHEVYFSAPAPDQTGEAFEAMLSRFVVDQKRVVQAQDDGEGRLRLGKYSLRQSADKHFFFKMPVDNVKFDPGAVLEFHFRPATYRLDMRELSDFLQNKSIFGGRMNARTGQSRDGLPVVFANHGAFVARPEETSLHRFVDELTRDLPANGEGARELRVQRVLDFVSREIIYDLRGEAAYNFEMLKKPNEVLMTGESDCSNKAILLGSLLEQLGEDYLFVYTPDHITVAVRQGGFPARNGLSLEWEGQTWLIAEGTVPGFRIGIDRVREEARLKQFQYVQRPRDRNVIFDLATGGQLSFQ